MGDLIAVFRMDELSIPCRIRLIQKMGETINRNYAMNLTEELQIELIQALEPNYDFEAHPHLKNYLPKKDDTTIV